MLYTDYVMEIRKENERKEKNEEKGREEGKIKKAVKGSACYKAGCGRRRHFTSFFTLFYSCRLSSVQCGSVRERVELKSREARKFNVSTDVTGQEIQLN